MKPIGGNGLVIRFEYIWIYSFTTLIVGSDIYCVATFRSAVCLRVQHYARKMRQCTKEKLSKSNTRELEKDYNNKLQGGLRT